MKKSVKVNNRGIDSSGITKDHKEAIAELIWNSFDAMATSVHISFDTNETDYIESIKIIDNGHGINIEDIDETFGSFLDSKKKKSFQRSSYIRGKKGKGRFSFSAFANKAIWHTVFKSDKGLLEYDITVAKGAKENYDTENQKIVHNKPTGTILILSELFNVTAFSFTNDEFKNFLSQQFGWFLFLNKGNNYSISINDEPIKYEYLIGDSEEKIIKINDDNNVRYSFDITYIRWNEKMGDKCYYYLLNTGKYEKAKVLTSYNNNAIEFHHSVFVKSTFFDDFVYNIKETDSPAIGKNQRHPVYKRLSSELDNFVEKKQKEFVKENAAVKLIDNYERKGIIPQFSNSKLGKAQKKDLIVVVKEIYATQPKIFKSLKDEQAKTVIGFLNLLLNSEERDHIINIIDSVTKLSPEERLSLSNVIAKSKLSNIIKAIKLLESRFTTVEILRKLVFDNSQFTTERDHVQKAIQENYWLFGEQFHIVSADEPFETALKEYLYILDGIKSSEKQKITNSQKQRRMDLFICRKRAVPDLLDHEYTIEENVIVELKRPSVKIGIEQYRQVEDYLEIIIKESQFNSQKRKWKFFLISKEIDGAVSKKYETMKDKNKRYLVNEVGNYEIYAMTWDDIFHSFEIKHKFLFDKLDFDKKVLADELKSMGFEFGKKGSDKMTNEVIELSTNNN